MTTQTNKQSAGNGKYRIATPQSHRTMKMALLEAEGIPRQAKLRLSGQATQLRCTGMDATGHITEENYVAYAKPTMAQKRSLARLIQQAYDQPEKQTVGAIALSLPSVSEPVKADPSTKMFAGIDGGSSGAIAASRDLVTWEVHLVATVWNRGHRLLAVKENLEYLKQIAAPAGGQDQLVVAYEQSRKNPMFGVKNAHVNGRNEEFWRVLLSLTKIPFCSVDPKTWQSVCFKGIPGSNTKERAREYVRRRCPNTGWLEDFNKAPREAIVDAMCIAIWLFDQQGQPLPPAEGVAAGTSGAVA
jgi:hypothetical protein